MEHAPGTEDAADKEAQELSMQAELQRARRELEATAFRVHRLEQQHRALRNAARKLKAGANNSTDSTSSAAALKEGQTRKSDKGKRAVAEEWLRGAGSALQRLNPFDGASRPRTGTGLEADRALPDARLVSQELPDARLVSQELRPTPAGASQPGDTGRGASADETDQAQAQGGEGTARSQWLWRSSPEEELPSNPTSPVTELRERGFIAQNRKVILGVSEIRRAWYGSPRSVQNKVRQDRKVDRQQQQQGQAAPNASAVGKGGSLGQLFELLGDGAVMNAVGDLPPLPSIDVSTFWDSLWSADGCDVTQQVVDLMRTDTSYNISYVCLPADFNAVFGDPSFGNHKVLVTEYRDSNNDNLTAVWGEKGVRPRVWKNQDRQFVADEIAATRVEGAQTSDAAEAGEDGRADERRGTDAQGGLARATQGTGKLAADGSGPSSPASATQPQGADESTVGKAQEQAQRREALGNVWLQQLLLKENAAQAARDRVVLAEGSAGPKDQDFLSIDLFTEDLFSEDTSLSLSADEELANPPPPVIPFIKYASPGPPKSPWTSPDCTEPEFRILSLDGGGVRGVLTAVILGRILKEVPTFLDNVDLIAGTSTGGLMGLMLAAGYTPEECESIYKYACPLIFAKDPWRVYNPLIAKYNPAGRAEICKAYLDEDRTLKDLKKHVVITSFKLDGKVGQMGAFISMNGGWRPAVFSNIPKLEGKLEPDLDLRAWDAAMRTSAAPTYFPSHQGYVGEAIYTWLVVCALGTGRVVEGHLSFWMMDLSAW